ncbi:DUF1934 domain-containing protein [Pelosinus sp. sgz500959]|uniref:DUF1934 domain-containing protein n=1 Tax=Pelosinus sp. sgz500959 TaxID=3242472 RepID=UPI00366FF63E
MINVVVTIVGTQRDAQGEENRIELITAGHYYEKNGVQYIVYKDTEVSGLEGVSTMLKVYEQHVVLVRMGNVKYQQQFRLGEKSHSSYVTPYVTMEMGILTQSIEQALSKSVGNIHIRYELEINGQWQSTNTLSISVREESKSGY